MDLLWQEGLGFILNFVDLSPPPPHPPVLGNNSAIYPLKTYYPASIESLMLLYADLRIHCHLIRAFPPESTHGWSGCTTAVVLPSVALPSSKSALAWRGVLLGCDRSSPFPCKVLHEWLIQLAISQGFRWFCRCMNDKFADHMQQ